MGHHQGQPQAQAAHPEHLATQAAHKAVEAGHKLKDRAVGFALDVRDNMAQREAELGEALGIEANPDRYPELPAPRRVVAIENSNTPKDSRNPRYVDSSSYPYNRNEDH